MILCSLHTFCFNDQCQTVSGQQLTFLKFKTKIKSKFVRKLVCKFPSDLDLCKSDGIRRIRNRIPNPSYPHRKLENLLFNSCAGNAKILCTLLQNTVYDTLLSIESIEIDCFVRLLISHVIIIQRSQPSTA